MRVIGIDPGLRRTGWGVVDVDGVIRHVANGVCVSEGDDLATRLCSLYTALAAVVAAHRPEAAAVEQTFVSKDAAGTLKLGQARGVVIMVAARSGIDVGEYAARLVKKAVVGVGNAEKTQVHAMVDEGLGAEEAFVGNENGDAKAALAAAERVVEADYYYGWQHHVTMEPMNATALYTPDKLEVWTTFGPDSGDRFFQNRSVHFIFGLGRLKPGVSKEQAANEVSTVFAGIQQEHPGEVDRGLPPRRGVPVEDIDPHMPVVQQRVAGRQHEEQAVHVDDGFLHGDGGQPEDVAHHHQRELDRDHADREPGDGASDGLVDRVDRSGQGGELAHGCDLPVSLPRQLAFAASGGHE